MKVVVAASDGPSLLNFQGALVRAIVQRGHDVTCISCEPPEQMAPKIQELGASYVQVPMSRTGTAIVEDLKTIRAFKRVLKELKPDVFFASMSKPVAYGGMAAKMLKIPNIYVLVSGLEIAFYSKGIKNAIVRTVLTTLFGNAHKACKKVMFLNRDDRQRFLNLHIVKPDQAVIVNGLGVNRDRFQKAPLPEEPIMLMVARLVWSKGIREYLQAAQIVREKHPQARFILVGGLDDNPESLSKEELDAAIQTGLVEYLGFSSEVWKLLESCSVFVLPSYHEGLPQSVMEAMAVGRPIVTTTAPGCRETVVDGENGYLVPVGDGETLAERILQLVENPELRESMGERSYEICKEKYDLRVVTEQIMNEMEL